MDGDNTFYLMKHEDGTVFGPVTFNQIREWARQAQISPMDKVSTDEKTWNYGSFYPEFEMDYLIEASPDQYYGPTTVGAVEEFFKLGEIGEDTIIINCKEGSEQLIRSFAFFKSPKKETKVQAPEQKPTNEPALVSIRQNLQLRIRELEESLLHERRARKAAEQLNEKLQTKLQLTRPSFKDQ